MVAKKIEVRTSLLGADALPASELAIVGMIGWGQTTIQILNWSCLETHRFRLMMGIGPMGCSWVSFAFAVLTDFVVGKSIHYRRIAVLVTMTSFGVGRSTVAGKPIPEVILAMIGLGSVILPLETGSSLCLRMKIPRRPR
jgi:hypothetical protein